MTQEAAFPESVYPSVSEQVENEIMRELAQEMAEEVFDEIEATFPGYLLSPAVEIPPRQRLERYFLRLVEAYPQDEGGRLNELFMLLDAGYLDKLKAGAYPPPLARPWVQLVRIPRLFRYLQRDFRQAYLTYAKQEDDGPV